MSFNISKKLIATNEDGSIKVTPITAKLSGKTYEYVKVSLPSNVNFGGFKDITGNEIFGVESANILVPRSSLMNDKFNDEKVFVKLNDDYVFPNVNIDLGLTGNKLEDGRDEHNFTELRKVPLHVIEDSFGYKQWLSFTITEKMRGTDYQNARGEDRTTVLIPADRGELSGGRFTISPKNIRPVKNHDHLLAVSLHRDAKFTVMKSEAVSVNQETGETEYVNTVLGENVDAKSLASYFEVPDASEKELIQEAENIEEHQDDGMEVA